MILSVGYQNKNGTISLRAKTWMIMKLTIVLLLFFTFEVSANDGYAQKITIIKKNVHLAQIFKSIEKQTGLLFFYDKALIKKTEPIDVSIKDATLDQTLHVCLKDQQLIYSIVRNTIVIQPVKISQPQVQNISIIDIPIANIVYGKVANSKGEPLVGVSVTVKGTPTGTSTDEKGSYSIDVTANGTLVFSYVGFATREMPVNGRSTVDIVLVESVSALDQVVVVGYGTQRKKDLTGAVTVVNVAEMNKQPTGQVTNQLQGQASGVTVLTSGQPGEEARVTIRGLNTFGNNSPLYIVDGVATQNLSDINPNDVASIQVLKDAGAASIYGSRAANGVLIITTKRGTGQVKVQYDAYYGTQRPKQGNVWNLLSPQDMADLQWSAYRNAGLMPGNDLYGHGASPVLPDYIMPVGKMEGDPATDPSLYNVNPNYTSPDRKSVV